MQIIGHGTQLELDTTPSATGIAGDTWTTIAGVMSVDFGSNKLDTIETTDLGTPGIAKTYIGGLEDPGDISVKINYKPTDASQAALALAKDGTLHYFKVIYPGAVRTIVVQGVITSIDESIPDDKMPTWTVKIKISGSKTIS